MGLVRTVNGKEGARCNVKLQLATTRATCIVTRTHVPICACILDQETSTAVAKRRKDITNTDATKDCD
eukprot:6204005-Pleurochrysis_carterae.AAC.3